MGESLLKDGTNYRLTCQTYLKHMHQLPPQREWMENKLGPRLSTIFATKKNIKVLAVGTGSGEVDIDFLNEIVKRGKENHGEEYSVIYQVVEPNPSSVDYFRSVATKNDNFSKVTFQWFTGFFEDFYEEFSKTGSEENKFDFVHFVRCFYHINSVKGINTTYDHFVAKNGILAVVGETENSFWPRQMIFLNDHGLKHDGFSGSGPVSQAYFLPGWVSQASENNWKYEIYNQKYYFDVTPMFDENSLAGNHLLDFCFHVRDSRNDQKKDVLTDFFQFLNKHIEEKIVNEDGNNVAKKYSQCELGAIIITKQ